MKEYKNRWDKELVNPGFHYINGRIVYSTVMVKNVEESRNEYTHDQLRFIMGSERKRTDNDDGSSGVSQR